MFSQSNLQKFKQSIAKIDWNNLVDFTDDVTISFQRFYDRLILRMTKTCMMVRSPPREKSLRNHGYCLAYYVVIIKEINFIRIP